MALAATTEEQELWLRFPGESSQAYARFLVYRDQPIGERSIRKVGVSRNLASRWSARWSWVRRAEAWDSHLAAAVDSLGLAGAVRVRRAQLDAGLALVTSAHESAAKLDRTKQNAESVALLLDAGARHSRIAVGLPVGGESASLRESASSQVAVAFGSSASGQFGSVRVGPAWLAQPQPNEAERDATKANEPVVQVGEQVLAEGNAGQPRGHRDPGRLVNQINNNPPSKLDSPRESAGGGKDGAKRRTYRGGARTRAPKSD